jgi:hypothetical protein
MEDVNEKLTPSSYGQDLRCNNQTEILEYLAKHVETGLYQTLLNTQQALDLE